jgi:hypothetical protein
MKKIFYALLAAATGLGGLSITATEADARRVVVVRSAPVIAYRPRTVWRYYARPRYVAPLVVAPAVASYAYYNSGRRYSCAELEYRCDKGAEWACNILERDPNC